jgi:translocation and assembly module TamB
VDIATDVAGDDEKIITFSRLTARDEAFTMALTSPAAIAVTPDRISAENIQLAVAGGSVRGSFDVNRQDGRVTGAAQAEKIGLAAFVPGGYAPSAGTAEGTLSIGGSMTDATLTATLNAHVPADRRNATPAFTARIDLTGGGGRLAVDAKVEGFSPTPATVVAEVPFRLDLTGPSAVVDGDSPLQMTAHWDGSIAPLWRLLPVDEHLVSGDALLDVVVGGTPANPQVQGNLHLTNGSYENIPGGTVLRNVDLTLSTERGNDFVVAMTATDTGSGTAVVSGKLSRDAEGAWTSDLAGEILQLAILARDDVTASASGKLRYTGPLLSGLLKGDLAVVRGTIHLDATGVPEVPLLRSHKFSRANDGQGEGPAVVASPMTLDISLSMADPLRAEGRGLDSVWRGDLYVGGSIVALDLEGGLAMQRGTFSFLGQSFELESGTVTFTGGGGIDPQLSVVAIRDVTDITVTVGISGRASAPSITLSSRPSLPQDEILARLLFNRNAGELGPLESLQLANAAADMSGLARGGISGIVRRTFGLDTFGFGGRSGDALVVGRQLGRNIFVSVEQSVNSTNRLFIITWRLSSRFSLRSSASDQTGADIGVFWRKDY